MITQNPNILFNSNHQWAEIEITKHLELIKSPQKDTHWLSILENQYQSKIYGGWMENRSPFFDQRHVPKSTIHLGLDFWLPSQTPVFCPEEGKVLLSRPMNTTKGGWGARTDIQIGAHIWIFGHLKEPVLSTGDTIQKNQRIGTLGTREENGGWLPHLHLQIMQVEKYLQLQNPSDLDAYAEPSPHIQTIFPHPLKIP